MAGRALWLDWVDKEGRLNLHDDTALTWHPITVSLYNNNVDQANDYVSRTLLI